MKKKIRSMLTVVSVITGCFALAACGGSGSTSTSGKDDKKDPDKKPDTPVVTDTYEVNGAQWESLLAAADNFTITLRYERGGQQGIQYQLTDKPNGRFRLQFTEDYTDGPTHIIAKEGDIYYSYSYDYFNKSGWTRHVDQTGHIVYLEAGDTMILRAMSSHYADFQYDSVNKQYVCDELLLVMTYPDSVADFAPSEAPTYNIEDVSVKFKNGKIETIVFTVDGAVATINKFGTTVIDVPTEYTET